MLLLAVVFLGAEKCNSTAQTTQGPRPAAEVIAQDAVFDLLDYVGKIHAGAVAAHDARAATEDATLHARHRQNLLDSGAALRGAYKGLAAWKMTTGSSTAPAVLKELIPVLPSLAGVAAELGVLDDAGAQKLRMLLSAALAGGAK